MITAKQIWFGGAPPALDAVNARGRGNMVEHLAIVFTEARPDALVARMPVDHRTKQPIGLLHGGASAALAETVGSTAANLVVDPQTHYCVGLDINANHVRSCRDGFVEAVARPLHLGRTTQVWEILVTQEGKLVCVSRLTMSVLERKA